jgi:hypothetical protein
VQKLGTGKVGPLAISSRQLGFGRIDFQRAAVGQPLESEAKEARVVQRTLSKAAENSSRSVFVEPTSVQSTPASFDSINSTSTNQQFVALRRLRSHAMNLQLVNRQGEGNAPVRMQLSKVQASKSLDVIWTPGNSASLEVTRIWLLWLSDSSTDVL